MSKPEIVLLISGKRKCGKDFMSSQLISRIGNDRSEIIRISAPIKSHWAHKKGLNLEELLSDGPYKEQYRKEMIVWSDSVRAKEPGYFCAASMSTCTKPIVIVSDIRRKTDIKFFQSNGYHIRTIRINAGDDVRQVRGWLFECGVDDVPSECDLDDYDGWDLVIENGDNTDSDASIRKILDLLP